MKPTAKPPLADTWQTNLESVLSALVTDGVQRVSIELASQPDAERQRTQEVVGHSVRQLTKEGHPRQDREGRVRLVVRRCQCGLCRQSEPSALASPALETRDDLTPGHK